MSRVPPYALGYNPYPQVIYSGPVLPYVTPYSYGYYAPSYYYSPYPGPVYPWYWYYGY